MVGKQLNYRCPRCNHTGYETGEIHMAGGTWSKIFNVEGRKFTTVTCSNCRYTEMYEVEASKLQNVFDLFVN